MHTRPEEPSVSVKGTGLGTLHCGYVHHDESGHFPGYEPYVTEASDRGPRFLSHCRMGTTFCFWPKGKLTLLSPHRPDLERITERASFQVMSDRGDPNPRSLSTAAIFLRLTRRTDGHRLMPGRASPAVSPVGWMPIASSGHPIPRLMVVVRRWLPDD